MRYGSAYAFLRRRAASGFRNRLEVHVVEANPVAEVADDENHTVHVEAAHRDGTVSGGECGSHNVVRTIDRVSTRGANVEHTTKVDAERGNGG
jgi:hypothetical protein